jgi:hypothetical protein
MGGISLREHHLQWHDFRSTTACGVSLGSNTHSWQVFVIHLSRVLSLPLPLLGRVLVDDTTGGRSALDFSPRRNYGDMNQQLIHFYPARNDYPRKVLRNPRSSACQPAGAKALRKKNPSVSAPSGDIEGKP